MTETTTASENNKPRWTEHRTSKNALTTDLDHFISPSHTRLTRTIPKHISIGTRATIKTNGQRDQRETSEQDIKTRRNQNNRKIARHSQSVTYKDLRSETRPATLALASKIK
jgi:hypothetical protein